MFEVGVKKVKEEIQRRLAGLLDKVFDKYEAGVLAASQALGSKYKEISEHLGKQLTSPSDVVDMERYKNNLLLEMGRL